MSRRPAPLPSRRDTHATVRALGSLAASLLAVNLALWFWPSGLMPATAPPPPPRPAEAIVVQAIEPTRQPPPPANLPPPPPPSRSPDLPPLEVPDEVLVERIRDELPLPPPPDLPPPTAAPRPAGPTGPPAPPSTPGPPAPPAPPGPPGPSPSATRIVDVPDRTPRIQQQTFPVYPDELRRDGLRARVTVRVLVSESGQVLEAEVTDRHRIERGEREVAVASLPASLEQSALDAARRHRFRAARDDGERVRAYAVITLSFDPSQR